MSEKDKLKESGFRIGFIVREIWETWGHTAFKWFMRDSQEWRNLQK